MAETPPPPSPGPPAVVRGLPSLWHDRRKRGGVLLAIFLLILVSNRGGNGGGSAPAAQSPDPPDPQSHSVNWSEQLVQLTRNPDPSEAALESLLSRYDAVIRMLETRAASASTTEADTALADLRALRLQTYSALRRALLATSTGPPPRPTPDQPPDSR